MFSLNTASPTRFIASAKRCLPPCARALMKSTASAEYNQAKVIAAMQKNRVNAACFAATTGYGYDDVGRDNA